MARLFDDASTQYLQSASTPVTDPPYTLAAWAYDDGLANWHTAISIADASGNVDYGALMIGATSVNYYLRDAAAGTGCTTTTGPTVDTWHHVCAVVTAADDRAVFIDGGSKGISAVSRTPAGIDAVGIGTRVSNTKGWYFSGRVAEPAIWNVALTDAEVGMLALGISPFLIRPANLVAYWPLIRTDRDRVGGYDMTAYNAPTWADHPPAIRSPWLKQRGIFVPAAAAGGVAPQMMHYARLRSA